ncbi:MAG: serine/threonine-protein kinase [Pirellulales bacterium]
MGTHLTESLPPAWWQITECVDAFEAARDRGVSDLRGFAAHVSPDYQPAAITELAAVDMECRWEAGEPKLVEQYLEEYPEIAGDAQYAEELIAQEYQVRRDCGEKPAIDEYRRRFPKYDVERVVTQIDTGAFTISSSTLGMRTPPADPLRGTIGRYEVREEIGAGAFGRVYRCYDAKLKRDVAIKLPHRNSKTRTVEQLQQFRHEAQSAARLQHPGIVSVLDTGELEDGRGYVVYECVKGQTLRDRIKARTYTREQAVNWCIAIAEALHYAHTHKVVHRDVSPANVLLDQEGHVHLTDLGLSKLDDQYFCDESGRVLGNVAYISPEQARQAHWASPQADIYSLGVILYELLTGTCPFDLKSPRGLREALTQVEQRIPDPPRTVDGTISAELEAVCLKAMDKNPANRYTTAFDMAAALRAATSSTRKPALGRRRVVVGLLLVGAAILVAMAFVVYVYPPWKSQPEPASGKLEITWWRVVYDRPPFKPRVLTGTFARLPLVDGAGMLIEAELSHPAYLYVLGGYPNKRLKVLHQTEDKVSEFSYPQEQDFWAKLTPGEGHGREVIILVASDTKLPENDVRTLQKLEVVPSDRFLREYADRLVELPIPKRLEGEMVRGHELFDLKSNVFGEQLSSMLTLDGESRAFVALSYVHDPDPEARGNESE